MAHSVDTNTQNSPPAMPVVYRNMFLIAAEFIRYGNRDFVNVSIIVQHVHNISVDFVPVSLSNPLLDENLPVESEIVGSASRVVGNVTSDDVFVVLVINHVQPDNSLNFDAPQMYVHNVSTKVNDILPPIKSPTQEEPSNHNVDPATIEETTAHVSSPDFDNSLSTSSCSAFKSVTLSSASLESVDDDVPISQLRKAQRQSSRLKAKGSGPSSCTHSRWSGFSVGTTDSKFEHISLSSSEDDIVVVSTSRNKRKRRKIPPNVPSIPIDEISFHNVENVQKWKYVVQRRIADEKVLFDQTVSCLEIMELIHHTRIENGDKFWFFLSSTHS